MKKKNWLISLLIIPLLVAGCNKKEEEQKEPTPKPDPKPVVETSKVSLVAVGDALIHNGVYFDASTGQIGSDGYQKYDFTKMFTHIKEVIAPYDLRFYNQETVIGGKNLGLSNYPLFNSPDEIGLDLIKTGFNLVNLATNHTMDKGAVGAEYSAKFWEKQEGVYAVGSYSSQAKRDEVVIKEVNGIKYALLGYTYGTNGIPVPTGKEYLVNLYSDAKAKADIEKVRDKVDLLIVSMHWGTEYQNQPNELQKKQAKYLASLGVDVIIGTHPHVIQPVEFVDDTLVMYSLGNFISAQDGTNKRIGMMAAFTFNKTTTDGKVTDVNISDVKADLLWTDYQYYTKFHVLPFNKVTDNHLYNSKGVYEQYKKYINPKQDERIQVGFFQ